MDADNSSAIKKIKLQEQDNDAKLKEKRELEDTISSLNKAIHDATRQAEKSEQEQEQLTKSTDSLRIQKMLLECRRDALSAQLNSLKAELKELQAKSNEGISKVWEMCSSFCNEVHSTSDACDVWTLLMKPGSVEPVSQNVQKKPEISPSSDSENEIRLRIALERRVKALAERDRLATEPDNGEEFMRNLIKPNRFHRLYSTEIKENEPIKFSTSHAAKKSIPSVFRNKQVDSMPWYQPFSVVGSVAVFLLYFCVLREENDVDKEFTKTLYERIKGLEKEQLLQSYKFNKENGLSVAEIEKRLQEIEAEEAKLAA